MSYGIRLHVWGSRACFTRPEMKAERVSYDVMTPSAARGILEAIYWKPAIRWIVDAIHVLKPIRFTSIRRNEVGSKIPYSDVKSAFKARSPEKLGGLVIEEQRQQRATTMLSDVAYIIEAHFEMTQRAGPEDNPGKHLDVFNRRARKGQCFHQPCLGTREFPAAFTLIEPDSEVPRMEPHHQTPELGFHVPRDLGTMLWDIEHNAPDKPSRFFKARLENGVLKVPGPHSGDVIG
ncbi:type I-C CRISPR-associated protein Cas5c [Woodsholea maritima]|uniref:type I-C CRISPR-associated protein Cas5c n=1 Tax=Woodsholea maritima TaxID=240237 RepID=UPI000476326D|nr:type I-C CRISPR-associated protein Cas5c [Woodsholea maritima]